MTDCWTEDWKVIWSPASNEELAKWRSNIDGADLNPGQSTPSVEHILCREIMSKDYDLVRSCISHGAKLNSWVYGSVWRVDKSLELFQIFVPAGLDINHKDDKLGSYVAATANRNQMELTRYLLEHGADPNRNPLIGLYLALNMAVKGNHTEMAEMLIKYGARVNGLGTLAMAAQYRRFEMMELLFRHGADVNDDTKDRIEECIDFVERTTALHRAAEAGHTDVWPT